MPKQRYSSNYGLGLHNTKPTAHMSDPMTSQQLFSMPQSAVPAITAPGLHSITGSSFIPKPTAHMSDPKKRCFKSESLNLYRVSGLGYPVLYSLGFRVPASSFQALPRSSCLGSPPVTTEEVVYALAALLQFREPLRRGMHNPFGV